MLETSNPTLKGRFLNLEKQAKRMKESLTINEAEIKTIMASISEATDVTLLADKTNFIRDFLNESLQRIDFKIKKHIAQQKENNHQLVELIGLIKNEKVRLQTILITLQARIEDIKTKIGSQEMMI